MTVYVVTTDADSGAGSLRNALAAAQSGDVIEFGGSLDDSIITLQSSLTIADGVTIDGGGDKITISGDDKYTDFVVANAAAGAPATLEGLTIANGDGVGSTGAAAFQNDPGGNGGDAAGGVMLSSGSLNLVNDAFDNDTATGGTGGAAHATGGGFFEQPAGNGGNAAGALYVELAGTIAASGLTFSNDTATPGQPGAPFPGEVTETPGSAYAVSNIAAFVDPTDFTVTTDADSGAGSLRAALAAATTYDIIEFAPSLDNSTITLQSSLTIAEGVTIDGIGDNITISGAGKTTDFIVANASTSEPVTLEGLTIANGDGVGSAGAAGTSSSPGGNGGDAAGGIMLSSGSLDLVDDAFNNDTATGGAGGAAWSSSEGPAKPSQAAGNGGNAAGAVYVALGATVTASNLAFSNDTANPGPGGAPAVGEAAGSSGAAYNITNDVALESSVYTVTTDADAGVGSLRYALTESLPGELIKFAPTLDGQTITLQSSLIIATGVTIDGLGDDITISGDDKYTDFSITNGINGPTPATLEGLTVAGGNATGSTGAGATTTAAGGAGGDAAGGLMVLNGALILVNDAFNNDTATGGAGGASSAAHAAGSGGNAAGAIYVEAGATVTATDLTFSGDTANAGQPGSNASGGGAGSAGAAYAISNTHYVDSGVYTVTTDADSGVGSLRALLAEAQTGDWINFASSLDNSTITLLSSLAISNGVTVDGFGDNITISGDDKFIIANAGAPVSLEGLIIAKGVNAAGGLYLSSGAVNLYNGGGGDSIVFSSGAGNAASLFSTANDWDGVTGSGGTIDLTSAQANVVGGGDGVDFSGGTGNAVSLYDSAGEWDGVSGSGGTIYLTSAQTNVIGGGDGIYFSGGGGNAVSLYDSAGDWDGVSGSGGTIYLTSAQTNVIGGGDGIFFSSGSGNAASLYDTANNWDGVGGSGGTVYLTSASANVSGGGDAIVFAGGSGNTASLYDTGGDWDAVTGSGGLVYLTSAQANIAGGLDSIDFAGGTDNAISIYSTAGVWDTVNGSGGSVYLTSAQASVNGDGDTIDLAGTGTIVSLGSTGASGDAVNGSGATVDLYGVKAVLGGSGDTVNVNESDSLTLGGGSETLAFQHGIGGADLVSGFGSSDLIQMSHLDFASFAALSGSGDLQQVGMNTVIILTAADSITLLGVNASTLTSGEFKFV